MLLHLSETHVHAGQEFRELGEICLSEVIGNEDLGTDDLRGIDTLVYRHRIRLIHREEGNVDVLDAGHLRDVLGVAGDVDAEAVDGEDEAVVAALRVEHGPAFGIVVGGDRIDFDVLAEVAAVAIGHHVSGAAHFSAAGVGDQLRVLSLEGVQGRGVVVVAVLVGDEDEVGLREFGGVVGGLAQAGDRIDLDGQSVVEDLQRSVLDEGEADGLAALGLEGFHLVANGALGYRFVEGFPAVPAGGQAQQGKNGHQLDSFHKTLDTFWLMYAFSRT